MHVRPRLALTLRHVWWLATPLLVFAAVMRTPIAPNDFWWHLRAAAYMWAHRTVPTVDLFSFTRYGAPWTYQAWLGELALYGLYRLGGAEGVLLAHGLIITTAYAMLAEYARRHYGVRPAVLATLLGAAVSMANWNVRPQTFSFPLFALMLLCLEAYRRGKRRWVWATVPLVALWANVHGAVIFGLALMAAYVAAAFWSAPRARAAWHAGLALAAAVATLALTPAGLPGMVRYFLGFFASRVTLQANVEFLPLTLRDPDGAVFVATVLLLVVLVVREHTTPALPHTLALLGLGLGTLWSHRVISWYGMALVPPLAEALARVPALRRPVPVGRPVLNVATVILLGGLAALGWPWWRGAWPPFTPPALYTPNTPIKAVAFLCERVPASARVYQEQAFGSYQIWACPQVPVFIDTRIELYPRSQWEDYFAIGEGRFDWEMVAAKYRLTHLLLSVADQPHAVRAARASRCWRLLYEDTVAVLFERTCPWPEEGS